MRLIAILVLAVFFEIYSARGAGLTLITHGFRGEDTSDGWLREMARAVAKRISPSVSDVNFGTLTVEGNPLSLRSRLELESTSGNSGEFVIILNWTDVDSLGLEAANTKEVAELAVSRILESHNSVRLAELPIHLIGHSRGGSLVSAIAAILALNGIWVDQMTTLDPRPLGIDPPATVYDNIIYADNYYQTLGNPSGSELLGAMNLNLNGAFKADNIGESLFRKHIQVHTWYHGTIDPSRSDPIDGQPIDRNVWYQIDGIGFALSRIANGENLRKRSSGWQNVVGLASWYPGGFPNSNRMPSTRSSENQWPNVADFRLEDSGSVFTVGEKLHMSFLHQDYDSSSDVRVFLDSDENPYNGNSGQLAFMTHGQSTSPSRSEFGLNSSAVSPGTYYLYAQITDGKHTRYTYAGSTVSVSSKVNDGPTLANPRVIPPSGTVSTDFEFLVDFKDPDGDSPSDAYRNLILTGGRSEKMTLKSGDPANGTYSFKTRLSPGTHGYSFFFADTKFGSTSTPFRSGPTVIGSEKVPINIVIQCPRISSDLRLKYSLTGYGGPWTVIPITKPILDPILIPAGSEVSFEADVGSSNFTYREWEGLADGKHFGGSTSSRWAVRLGPASTSIGINVYYVFTPQQYSIQGTVKEGHGSLVPDGVNLVLISSDQRMEQHSVDGKFSFSGVTGGVTVSITPSAKGYQFSPPTLVFPSLKDHPREQTITAYASDDQVPTTSIVTAPPSVSDKAAVTFAWTGDDDASASSSLVYQTRLDGIDSDWSAWSSATSKDFTLPNGAYTFYVRAKDATGNINQAPRRHSFVINANPKIASAERIDRSVWASRITLQRTINSGAQTDFILLPAHSATSDPELVPVTIHRTDGNPIGANEAVSVTVGLPSVIAPVSSGWRVRLPALEVGNSAQYDVVWGKIKYFGWQTAVSVPSNLSNGGQVQSSLLTEDLRLWRLATKNLAYGGNIGERKAWAFMSVADALGDVIPERILKHEYGHPFDGTTGFGIIYNYGVVLDANPNVLFLWNDSKDTWDGVRGNQQRRYGLNVFSQAGEAITSKQGQYVDRAHLNFPRKVYRNQVWLIGKSSGSKSADPVTLWYTTLDQDGHVVADRTDIESIQKSSGSDLIGTPVQLSDAVLLLWKRYWNTPGGRTRQQIAYQLRNYSGEIIKPTTTLSGILEDSVNKEDAYDVGSVLPDKNGKIWISYFHRQTDMPLQWYYVVLSREGEIFKGPISTGEHERQFKFCDRDGYIWATERDQLLLLSDTDTIVVGPRIPARIPNQELGSIAAEVTADGYRLFNRWAPQSLEFDLSANVRPETMQIFDLDLWRNDSRISNLSIHKGSTPIWTNTGRMTAHLSVPISESLSAGRNVLTVRQSDLIGGQVLFSFPYQVRPTQLQIPIITEHPKDQTVAAGSDALFRVVATGNPEPRYQWIFAGKEIPGANGSTLKLEKVTKVNAGIYAVSVFNSEGAVESKSATLTVSDLPPPAILAQPQSAAVRLGSSVHLRVITAGASHHYQWRKDGANLTGGARVSGANSDTLRISDVEASDAGTYSCLITNTGGATTSSDAVLSVLFGTNLDGGGIDTSFAIGTGVSGEGVWVVADGVDRKIYLGGNFNGVGGAPRNGIARLNSDGSLDASFNPSGADSYVFGFAFQPDGKILVGGGFNSMNGNVRPGVARLNSDGSLDPSFAAPFSSSPEIRAIALQPDGKIIAAGMFTLTGDSGSTSLVRLQAGGALDKSFTPVRTDAKIRSVGLQADGKIVVGGNFTTVNGTSRNQVARINSDGTLDATFNPGPGPAGELISVAVQSDGKILIGGGFKSVRGVSRGSIARLHQDGTLDESFASGAGANDFVNSIAVDNSGKVVVGGRFQQYDGVARGRFARLNPDGRLDDGFAKGIGADAQVMSVALDQKGNALIAGFFETVDGLSFSKIARFVTGGGGELPIIEIQPISQSVSANSAASFSVVAQGSAPLVYQWRKDGVDLTDNQRITGSKTPNLSIQNCREADSGAYTVIVTNPAGATSSQTAKLTVSSPTVVSISRVADAAEPNVTGKFKVMRTGDASAALQVNLKATGTAIEGTDYEPIPRLQTIPTGASFIDVDVTPKNDDLIEGPETVVITLAESAGYGIGHPSSATIEITDAVANRAPTINPSQIPDQQTGKNANSQIITLRVGDAETPCAELKVSVKSSDQKLVPDQNIQVQTAGDSCEARMIIRPSTDQVGTCTITVTVTDSGGLTAQSAFKFTVVSDQCFDGPSFANRRLPGGYVPGVSFRVTIETVPPASAVAYGVEDQPPAGWEVSLISDNGEFDPVNRKVKWTFLDKTPRTLTYQATPPANAAGTYQFSGEGDVNGTAKQTIAGNCRVNPGVFHPADIPPADSRLTLAEVLQYAAAFKRGVPWSTEPNPIPLSYVIRGFVLYKSGECYRFEPPVASAPAWWVPCAGKQSISETPFVSVRKSARSASAPTASAISDLPAQFIPGTPFRVRIIVTPATDGFAYGVEEQPPAGWLVTSISEGGEFDAVNGKVKWTFLDNAKRTLTYEVTPPASAQASVTFAGVINFDGVNEIAISGKRTTSKGPTRPINDDFANRNAVAGISLSVEASNSNATVERTEPIHAGRPGGASVWWQWTAPISGKTSISTHGSDFDSLLSVYTGDALSSLTLVAANDDDRAGNSTSYIEFDAIEGTTYQVAIDGFAGASGKIELNIVSKPNIPLKIEVSGRNVILSWPKSAILFELQAAEGLGGAPSWTKVTEQPTALGDQWILKLQAAATDRFYRLKQTTP